MLVLNVDHFVSEDEEIAIDLEDRKYYDVMRFYQEYTQNNLYVVPREICSERQLQQESFYNNFGIYFGKAPAEAFINDYMLVIPEDKTVSVEILESYIQEQLRCNHTMNFTCCAFSFNLMKKFVPECEKIKYAITKRFPNILLLNDFFIKSSLNTTSNTEVNYETLYAGYNVVNITDLFIKYSGSRDGDGNVRDFFNLCKEIIEKSNVSNCVFTIDNTRNLSEEQYNNYFKVVAYLSARFQLKFIIPRPELYVSFLAYCREMLCRERNLLEDYLDMLNNFPYFTVSLQSDVPSLFMKDLEKLTANYSNYAIKITAQLVQLDPSSLEIISSKVSAPTLIDINSVQINSIAKLFKLNTTSVRFTRLQQLDKLIYDYALLYRKTNNFSDLHLFNKSTLICFSDRGKMYFGYVNNISGSIPFIVQPLNLQVKPFRLEKSINDLGNLYDVSLVHDIDGILNRFVLRYPEYRDSKMWHFKYANYRGIASLFNLYKEQTHVTDNCGLTIAEAGLWNSNCNSFKDLMTPLGDILDESKLMERGILSYFGCTHPYLITNESSNKTEINISVDLWKGC